MTLDNPEEKKVLCLECNCFSNSIEDIANNHFKHPIYSEESLDAYLRKSNYIANKQKDLMVRLKEHVTNTLKLQDNVDSIKKMFGDIHERLVVEESRLKKPMLLQIEKSMEAIKNLYNEIINYWRMNNWMDQQSTSSQTKDDEKESEINLYKKLASHDQIKITKDTVCQVRDNSNSNSDDSDNSDHINESIINFTTGDIKSPFTMPENCFRLVTGLKNHVDTYRSFVCEKPITFSNIDIKEEFNTIIEMLSPKTVLVDLPKFGERTYSKHFKVGEFEWQVLLHSENKCVGLYLLPVQLKSEISVEWKFWVENYRTISLKYNMYKEGYGVSEYFKETQLKSINTDTVRVGVQFLSIKPENQNK